jgi:ATP-dependent Clp protease ATP-binding subunit ClpA
MSKNPDKNLEQALSIAKSHMSVDMLTPDLLFVAMVHSIPYKDEYPQLANAFPLSPAVHPPKEKVRSSEELKRMLRESFDEDMIVGDLLFQQLLFFEPLFEKCSSKQLRTLKESQQLHLLRSFQKSEQHIDLMSKLSRFGRIISTEGKASTLCGREELFANMSRALMKMLGNDVLLIGPKGIGKSRIIQEFARRIASCDPAIPRSLYGAEVFQLSAELLRSGVISRPEFQKRVRVLNSLLSEHPKIILVLNPLDALINADSRRTDQQLAEEAIRDLIESNLPVIATLTPQSYLLMDGKSEWDRIFTRCTVAEPSQEGVIEILTDQIEMFQEHYIGLIIDKDALHVIPELAKEENPTQCEPRRSVQFLDDLCVRAQTNTPPFSTLNEQSINILMEHDETNRSSFQSDELEDKLNQIIVGQKKVFSKLVPTIRTRLSRWSSQEGPRGVFLFGGPTGVGKTETAVQLAKLMDGNFIRINCNTLQSSGQQKTSIIWQLLGVPPGFLGHGEGGLLSKVRENPNAVILFDEFEKADPAVGKLLLQIIDTGIQTDNNGNTLDFRKSFIVFTSNLGCDYEGENKSMGFGGSKARQKKAIPKVDEGKLRAELKMMGYGPEFMARVHELFFFESLQTKDIEQIVVNTVQNLNDRIQEQGFLMQADAEFNRMVSEHYTPRDGVRRIINQLQVGLTRALSQADVEGLLDGVTTVFVRYGTGTIKREAEQVTLFFSLEE